MPGFTTPTPITADVDLAMGSVHVVASDRTDTTVTVLPANESRSGDVRAAAEAIVELDGTRLVVRTPRGWRYYGPFSPGAVDVTIELPTGSALEGRTGTGGLFVEGRLASARFRSAAGDLRMQEADRVDLKSSAGAVSVGRVTGAAQLATATGGVRVQEVSGTAVVKNSNGSTTIGEVTGELLVRGANGSVVVERVRGTLTARVANGDMRVERVEAGTVTLETSYGGVEVGVPEGTAAWLDVTSRHGAVRNRLQPSDAPPDGELTAEVHVRTVYGDVVVRRPEGAVR
jgi:hypothetical protein